MHSAPPPSSAGLRPGAGGCSGAPAWASIAASFFSTIIVLRARLARSTLGLGGLDQTRVDRAARRPRPVGARPRARLDAAGDVTVPRRQVLRDGARARGGERGPARRVGRPARAL